MEEDECDYRSPIGRIIKQINASCKKPKIDNQLSEALESFNDCVNEQQRYLRNGIFKTNFAETALFLQSCAELYGKKIDLLWDEMIAFLTRLITYDCEHEKEQGIESNQDVITKLEERRNKFKRKRKDKKAEEEAKKLAEEQAMKNAEEVNKITKQSDGADNTHPDIPAPIASNDMPDVSTITDKQEKENVELMKIPGWNDIQCLFEQIDERQLPDKNNLLAILKVCAYGRMTFLKEKNLPLCAPYSSYKEEYLTFRKKFFEEAAKKWQDVTFDTFEDLHKVLIYLSQKEKKGSTQSLVQLNISNTLSQLTSPLEQNLSNGDTVDQVLEHSDNDSLFELSFVCDDNNKTEKSDLFVHLEKLSSNLVDNKIRQDSGFYEFNSDESCNSFEHHDTMHPAPEDVPTISKTSNEIITIPSTELIINDLSTVVDTNNYNFCFETVSNLEENKENEPPLKETQGDDTDCDNNSIISDHDYCVTGKVKPLRERLGKRKKDQVEEYFANFTKNACCIVCKKTQTEKINLPKENKNVKDKELMPPPSKKRKISHKKIIKLLKSIVPAVEEDQFEKFFNENYQPESDEGPIPKLNAHQNEDEDEVTNENVTDDSEDESNDGVDDSKDESNDGVDDSEDESNDGVDIRKSLEQTSSAEEEIEKDVQSIIENLKKCVENNIIEESNGGVDIRKSLEQTSSAEEEIEQDVQSIIENLKKCVENNIIEENNKLLNNPSNSDEIAERHSDTDDTLSVFSEHSYCQVQENTRNDSGFVDNADIIEEADEQSEANIETLFECVDNIVGKDSDLLPFEEEYQRILHLLDESQKDMINEEAGLPTESQRREQEALGLQNRVQAWTNTIVPILNKLNEQDFDIHEYGTKIMNGIAINDSKPFGNIVEGMSSAEVTRYFISSLQLANTNNIEICGVKPGEISNDTFEIKLLNRDRYHEHIGDFQAPSKETFQERMKRLCNQRTNEIQFSEPVENSTDMYQHHKKRRKVEILNGNTTTIHSYSQYHHSKRSSLHERTNHVNRNSLNKDTNNNCNKNREHSSSSKSFVVNPQKGKSIKRKAVNTQHVSFEGSQAPQAISAQITGPRQLHCSLASGNQPSTSYAQIENNRIQNQDPKLDNFEQDFQRLSEVQQLYPHYQMQSTPRNEITTTCTQNSMYRSHLSRRIVFK